MSGIRSAGGLRFPFPDAPPTDGTLVDVAPGIKWLRMPLPLSLDHINLYLIRDDDGWMIVDTGLATGQTQTLWRQIIGEKLDGARISGVLCTHFHFDHSGLAGWLTDWLRVPLYMSLGEYYTLRTMAKERGEEIPWQHHEYFRQSGFSPESIDSTMAVFSMVNDFIDAPPAAYRRLRAGESLRIGGRDWQLHLGEGHSPEHMLLHCPQDKVMLVGDQLLPRITSNVGVLPGEPDSDLLTYWFASLDRLEKLPGDTLLLPAHDLPYYGLHERIAQLREHHEQQFARVREICTKQPLTALEVVRQLFPACKTSMDDLMALGETLSHLIHLRNRGEIERTLDADGVLRYCTVRTG